MFFGKHFGNKSASRQAKILPRSASLLPTFLTDWNKYSKRGALRAQTQRAMHIKKLLSAVTAPATFLLACIAFPDSLQAGDSDPKTSKEVVLAPTTPSSPFSGDIGVTYTSAYAGPGARDFNLQNRGWIFQPYLDLIMRLYSGDGFINSVTLNLGQWASVHERTTGATNGGGVAHWNEYDFYPGITVRFAKNFWLAVTYFEITSPAGAYHDAHPLYATLRYDDTDLLGVYALHPTFQYQYELPRLDGSAKECQLL